LQEKFAQKLSCYEAVSELKGILTSINPNLGFRAHAFRGVHYVPVGVKPANFTYLRDANGMCSYLPRREIQRYLSLNDSMALEHHPAFHRSCFPMAPTVEMLLLLNRSDHDAVLSKRIYVVNSASY